ncbi:type III secretion system translocon subunit VopD [Vibrio sp. AND4]|uniref:type III secretion system translocon subunit VopD n=1 Tax=Vibrio sp. AND4 TaxID=314289 RepID=UPI00015F0F7D|nr:type III secretion system translocon subunit VopD [Vibrio sp. AND4]EDP58942.1 putative translocator protein PopD [Vibrio sp. AND4]
MLVESGVNVKIADVSLDELDQISQAKKSAETKIEAASLQGSHELSTRKHQLDTPNAAALGVQAASVEDLIDAMKPTATLLMQTTDKALKGEQVIHSPSDSISQSLELVKLLYQVSILSRDQQTQQREMKVETTVSSIKSQAEELNNSAKAMVAMAIVSGVLAGATALIGGIGHFKTGTKIKSEAANNNILKTQEIGFDQVQELMNNKSLSDVQQKQVMNAYNFARGSLSDTKNVLQTGGRQFDRGMHVTQSANAMLSSSGQTANSVLNAQQTEAQARSKAEEAETTRSQAGQQAASDNKAALDNLLKELLTIFRSLSDSLNQTWKAAARMM